MDVTVKSNIIEFSGFLNEFSPIETSIKDLILQTSLNSEPQSVTFDFCRVKRGNSCGVLCWFKLMDELTFSVKYINMPIWLVEQFNYVERLPPNTSILSVQAPFYCPEEDNHENVVLVIGKDIPIQDDYENFTIFCMNQNGAKLEANFEPAEYFQFIVANPGSFVRGQECK